MGTSFWPWITKPEKAMEACRICSTKEVVQKSKVMAFVFWNCEAMLMIEYVQKGQTINGEYCAFKLPQLKEAIKSKRWRKSCVLVFCCSKTMPLFTQHKWQTQKRKDAALNWCPMYLTPDLAPSDFYLFPKSHLRGRRFESYNEVICAVEGYFGIQTADFFREGIANSLKSSLKFLVSHWK